MRPRQPELALAAEAPPPTIEVGGPDLARTLAGLRGRGFQVWAMDTKGATYRLHVRRAQAPQGQGVFLRCPITGHAEDRSFFVTPPETKFPLSFPLSAFVL